MDTPDRSDTELVEVVDTPAGPLALKADEAFAYHYLAAIVETRTDPSPAVAAWLDGDDLRAAKGALAAIESVGRLRRRRLEELGTLDEEAGILDLAKVQHGIGRLLDDAVATALRLGDGHAAAHGPNLAGLASAYRDMEALIPRMVEQHGEAIAAAALYTVEEVRAAIIGAPGVNDAFVVADNVLDKLADTRGDDR